MVFFTCDELISVLWGVCSIQRNGCEIWDNYVPLLQENEMLAGLHSRNLILGLECFFGFLPSERFFLIAFVLV